jgi:hypothetical protein
LRNYVLELVEQLSREDRDHMAREAALGDEIGFGALMSRASATWAKRFAERNDPKEGEFVAGPCRSTVVATPHMIRAARCAA